jgi:predicted kinase
LKFIVFSGLPGTGKSMLADAVGRELGIPVFAKDWLEATILRGGLIETDPQKPLGFTGYELLGILAQRQLSLGQSVILDSVATTESIRKAWRATAHQYKADWRVIECVCSNVDVHRERLEGRQRNIPGWRELQWEEVKRLQSRFTTWHEQRLILDSIQPFEENLSSAIEYCLK